jgi:hypothetical protein
MSLYSLIGDLLQIGHSISEACWARAPSDETDDCYRDRGASEGTCSCVHDDLSAGPRGNVITLRVGTDILMSIHAGLQVIPLCRFGQAELSLPIHRGTSGARMDAATWCWLPDG